MDALPIEVWSAAAVRAMDRRAIERKGIPGYSLMQRAGSAAFEAVGRHWPAARRIAVLCGGGNNAGDGYVLARLARAAGLETSVSALADPGQLAGDAALAFRDFAAAGGSVGAFDADAVVGADVVVDALLGTGVDRPDAGPLSDCNERVNSAGRPELALANP
jgi:NAD(P)H-hydrate epimerase